MPVTEAERLDGGTPDPGSPIGPDDGSTAAVADDWFAGGTVGVVWNQKGEAFVYRPEDGNAANRPGLGGLDVSATDADAAVNEERVVPHLPPRQPDHLTGAQPSVREQAYNQAVTGLCQLVTDRFDLSYRDWATLDRTLRDWLESDAGVALAKAVLHGRTDGGTQDMDGTVDGVPGLARPVEGGPELLEVPPRKLRKARAAKLRDDVEVEETGTLHLGAALPGNPVVVEPVVDPLGDGELAVGERCSVTLELRHEGDGLWLAGKSLRVHPAPGSPPYAPGFAGSFLMVEPHGPGSYTASVRGVVKSVVRLADG